MRKYQASPFRRQDDKLKIFKLTTIFLLLFAFSAYADQFQLIDSRILGKASVDCVQYSPNGQLLAVAQGNYIRLFYTRNYQEKGSPLNAGATSIVSMAFFSNNKLVSVYNDRKVRLWDLQSNIVTEIAETGHTPISIACSRSGIIAVGLKEVNDKGNIELYEIDGGSNQEPTLLEGHGYNVESVAFSSGNQLASASGDPEIRLWKWSSTAGSYQQKTPPSPIEGDNHDDDEFLAVAFSPLGNRFASGSSGSECAIKIWDANTGDKLSTLNGFNSWVDSVAFSMDGNYLAGGSYAQVKLFNAQTFEEISEVSPSLPGCDERAEIRSISFSPDSSQLAAGTADGYLLVWYLAKRGVPQIAVFPTEIDLGEVIIGNSKSRQLIISNTGGETLRVSGIESADDPPQVTPIPPEISISGSMNFNVYANSKDPHFGPTIVFTPISDGNFECKLSIVSDARNPSPIITITASVKHPAPTIEEIEPVSGTIDGGTAVTIRGTDFRDGATVTIDGNSATGVTVVSAKKITATTPEGTQEGKVDVVVTNEDDQFATLTDGFEYTTEAVIVVDRYSINFGNVDVGASLIKTVTVKNAGNATLSTTSPITISDAAFSVSPTELNVAPGASTQLDVTFAPQIEDAFEEIELTIATNAVNDSEVVIELNGIGGGGIKCEILKLLRTEDDHIFDPADGSTVNKKLEIFGTADVSEFSTARFSYWQLWYAPRDQRPDVDTVRIQSGAWTIIDDGITPVNADYFPTDQDWDTTELDDGLYTLRLRVVTKSPNETKDHLILVTIDNTPPRIYSLVMNSNPGGEEFTTSDKNDDPTELTLSGMVSQDTTGIVSTIFDGKDISDKVTLTGGVISASFNAGTLTADRAILELGVQDEVGNTATGYDELIVDDTDPTIKISQLCYSLINSSEYYSNFTRVPIPISGIAEDDTEIDFVEISFDVTVDEPSQRVWYTVMGGSDWSFGFMPVQFNSYCEFKVRATDLLGHVSDEVTAKVSYRDYWPDIHIWNPVDGLYLSDSVTVEGNASDAYEVEYRKLGGAANWQTVCESSQAPSGNYFSCDWDTRALNGIYQLRLTVGNKQVYRTNLHISSDDWLGDVNLDGFVDHLDAYAILKWVVGKYVNPFAKSLADVSGDGTITAYDAALIFQKVAGLIDQFPAELIDQFPRE